jgi:hypothetical protein
VGGGTIGLNSPKCKTTNLLFQLDTYGTEM